MITSKILAINPNPTTTKIAIYKSTKLVFLKTIKHKEEELKQFKELSDQVEYRSKLILAELDDNDINPELIHIIVSRGGLIKPLVSGVYSINKKMENDLKVGIFGQHANNLGGLIANYLTKSLTNAKSYIADPSVVDELDDVSRVSGHPLFERRSIFHALNQKSVSRKFAKSINKKYDELNLIVTHIESGISVGAHENGRVIDVNQAFDGAGPFSFERTGTLPVGDLLRLCFSGKYSEDEIMEMVTQKGGLVAYLGVNNLTELETKVESGDEKANFIAYAMAYQVAKEIGAMYTVLQGDIDGIILSGEIFHWTKFTNWVSDRIEKIGPIAVYPNEDEMEALAANGLMILRGEVEVLEYK
ncbi:MAG: butyrate kinase [Saprospiraceae bacterium]|nr:butyrate kinase [Saprospiraceae bacterium]